MDFRLSRDKNIICNFCELDSIHKNENNFKIDYKNIECCYNCFCHNNKKGIKIKKNKQDGYINIKLDNNLVFIKDKYYNNFKNILIKKKRDLLKKNKKLFRKNILLERLKEEKLEYINNSICDIYVNYGMLEIDYVIESIKKIDESKSRNYIILNNELNKKNIKLNKSVPSFNNFIKYGKNLNECIRIGIVESIVINETNYLSNLKKYSRDDSLDMAAIEYLDNFGPNEYLINYIENITTIKFN